MIFFGLLINTFHLPFYWDTAAFLIPSAIRFAEGGNLIDYLRNTGSDYPHTPLLPMIYSVVFQLPGSERINVHVLSFLFSITFLLVTFYLYKRFLSPILAKIGLFLFLTNPMFLSQTNLGYFEIIGSTLRLLTLLMLYKKWYRLTLAFALIALLIRFENGFILAGIFLVHSIKVKQIRTALMSLIMFVSTIFWLAIHSYYSGWWLYAPQRYFEENHFLAFSAAISYILFGQGRWYFSLIILLSILVRGAYSYKQKIFNLKIHQILGVFENFNFFLFLLVSLPTLLIITKLGYFLPRYIFPVLPVFYLIFLLVLQKCITNKYVTSFILALGIIIQVLSTNSCASYNFEVCGLLTNILEAKLRASEIIETNYNNHLVIGDFPEDGELKLPILGYVKKPIPTRYFLKDDGSNLNRLIYISPTSSYLLHQLAKNDEYQHLVTIPITGTKRSIELYEKRNE